MLRFTSTPLHFRVVEYLLSSTTFTVSESHSYSSFTDKDFKNLQWAYEMRRKEKNIH